MKVRFCLVLLFSMAGSHLVVGCAAQGDKLSASSEGFSSADQLLSLVDRLTWGVNLSEFEQLQASGPGEYLRRELRPTGPALAVASVDAQISGMTISQRPMVQIVQDMEQVRKNADAVVDNDAKKVAQQDYQQEMNRLARESASRHVLRALYSQHQVLERMTWFWMNHFNVHQYKSNLRAMVSDYEESAVRTHALGKFRALLGAVVRHPAMLRYLDNDQNAAGRINENFARELMELHTLGVDGGYTQSDVQELARVLTGVGVNLGSGTPPVKTELQGFYVRDGLFEFNPGRHDFGNKTLLGAPIRSHGLAELDEALDRLARHPATARYISRKLATYWLSDDPPAALVAQMGREFERSDGDIASTLRVLFDSPDFVLSPPRKFKDPMQFVVSAVRLAYDDKPVLNVAPILNWLNRMGEPMYGRQTPDGYPLGASAWASPGQMATRFEIAKAIGSGSAGLFRSEGPQPNQRPAFPQLANALYYRVIEKRLSSGTRAALDQAESPQEWNAFLLSSPELMSR